MVDTRYLRCDGCGQGATEEHVARRLRRLEWTTRYRPTHISSLFLGAVSPQEDRDFLYSPSGAFDGEAGHLLRALGIAAQGRPREVVLTRVQRAGFFFTHVLECPWDGDARSDAEAATLIGARLPAVAARIRRSLKPKRVVLVSEALDPAVTSVLALDLGCPVMSNRGKAFALTGPASEVEFLPFRETPPGAANLGPFGQVETG